MLQSTTKHKIRHNLILLWPTTSLTRRETLRECKLLWLFKEIVPLIIQSCHCSTSTHLGAEAVHKTFTTHVYTVLVACTNLVGVSLYWGGTCIGLCLLISIAVQTLSLMFAVGETNIHCDVLLVCWLRITVYHIDYQSWSRHIGASHFGEWACLHSSLQWHRGEGLGDYTSLNRPS